MTGLGRRSWRWLAAALLCSTALLQAGPIITPIEIYGTGDPASQGTQTVDTHWSLVTSPGLYPDNGSSLYIVDTAGFPFNGAWVADYGPAARWIAPQPSYNHGQSDLAGLFTFQTTFTLDDPTLDLSTAMLWGDVSSDNCTTDLIVNGQSTGFNMRALNPGAACIKTHYSFQLGGSSVVFTAADGSVFTQHVNFLAGLNTIQFKVSNYVCGAGCTQNPTGIIVKIQGNVDSPGDPEPTPEPATAGLAGLALVAAGFLKRRRHTA